jgi:4-aminobutyrate aminotransferase/diaminobutyrate-pyruvate transaminase/4-aminobutyrate aminotransferase/(S)-3-amino-2-methylpropionate transaminase
MEYAVDLTPKNVPPVATKYRRIQTAIPAPESVPILKQLYDLEPIALQGQPPVVWDHAEGFQVYDNAGNCWIDWSAGVLITNAGHGRKEIVEAIRNIIDKPLLTTFAFASEVKATLVKKLESLFPDPLNKVLVLSTGSEAVENAIKFARTHGVHVGGRSKNVIVSFSGAFHGRTLGSQQAGGIPSLKEWIINLDQGFVQVPFPDGYLCEDTSFDYFLKCLGEAGVEPRNVAGVMLETYQGGNACFAPVEYIKTLRDWCTGHNALLIFDEVQAGFGRTGKFHAFEHYGVVPDLCTGGKGLSGSLPQSALAGRADVLDLHPPLSMTNTHAGSPVPCAATLASIDIILNEKLTENSAKMGELLDRRLQSMWSKHPEIGFVASGRGLVAGIALVKPGTKEPDGALAKDVTWRLMEKGVLMFAPVGAGLGTLKICPPLMINEEAMIESLDVLEEVFAEALAAKESGKVPA